MVREGNTAMDRGEFHDADRGAFLDTLERWDRIFAVLEDDDHAKLVKFGFVALDDGGYQPSPQAAQTFTGPQPFNFDDGGFPVSTAPLAKSLGDEQIEKLIAERVAARRGGNYARSDEIRASLLKAGVILEDTKAGTRWKRK
jgi:hypothetical protein